MLLPTIALTTNAAISPRVTFSVEQYVVTVHPEVIPYSRNRSMAAKNESVELTSAKGARIMVLSVALAAAEPPPERFTWLAAGEATPSGTFARRVIAG